MDSKKSNTVRIIASIFSILAISIGLISWASGVGIQAEQNRVNIEKISESLNIECEIRAKGYKELDAKIQANADANKKEFTEIKVQLAAIDTKQSVIENKQDMLYEYMLKIYGRED